MRRLWRATARRILHRGALALLLLVLLLPAVGLRAPATTAAQASGVTIAAEANFGGNHQADAWVPITVQLANAGPDVTGDVIAEAVVAGPQGNARYSQRVELPTRSRKALTLYALVPAFPTALDVSFTSGRDTVAAPRVQLRPLKPGQRLIGVLGDDEQAGGALARALLGAYGGGVEAIAADPGEMPDNPYGLGSFSSLVLRDAATDRWSPDQRQALAGWVARGGRLVVVGGPAWRRTGEGLGELPPVRFADSRAADGLSALSSALGLAGAPAGGFVLATGDVLQGATRLAE